MAANAIACAVCSWQVPRELWNREESVRCRGCGQAIRVAVFPAIDGIRTGLAPEPIREEAEASCFYHSQSRASAPCDECGRFLCELCKLDVHGRILCPRCFESGVSAQKIETVETRRVLYDTMALVISIVPALAIWPAVISAPATLFIVFRHWNDPGSILPRTKVRYVLATLFALAEIVGIGAIIYAMIVATKPRG